MFDTVKIGQRIAELRKKENMTQFELADKLGISFQAVSNWERGNSMPDISKLPEMAEIFHTSIDEILGKSNRVVSDMSVENGANCYSHLSDYSKTDLDEAAQIMTPAAIEDMVEKSNCALNELAVLFPYLSEDYLDGLADRVIEKGGNIKVLLPFLSVEKIDALASNGPINMFLPFMSDSKIKELAFIAYESGGMQAISSYIPYLAEADIRELAEKYLNKYN